MVNSLYSQRERNRMRIRKAREECFMARQIFRSSRNSVVGGVCGGLGEYFDIDPVIIRVIWLLLLFSGIGFFAYLIAWVIIPRRPYDEYVVIEQDDDQDDFGRM